MNRPRAASEYIAFESSPAAAAGNIFGEANVRNFCIHTCSVQGGASFQFPVSILCRGPIGPLGPEGP